jgi:PEP-CTERM motif
MSTINKTHDCDRFVLRLFSTLAGFLLAGPAFAAQFSFLDPAYTQEIYAGPNVGLPGAWTPAGELLARKSNVPQILQYSATQNAVYQGTNVHGLTATHNITGLAQGNNLARAMNGFLYLPTSVGLQRVDSSNWALPAVTVTPFGGGGYGVNSLPNGNVVYAAGSNSTDIHIYNPTTNVDALVYVSPGLIDDIETSQTGLIALAGQGGNNIILLNSSGGFIQQINTTTFPDGLAFNTTASPPALYSNDNQGTIIRYDFGGGYTAAPTNTTTIASGGSYGDIACTGYCSFFVTQFYNGGYHGSALYGTHWDNNVTNNDPSIIRIGSKQGCLFDPPVGFNVVPEPSALALVVLGFAGFACRRTRFA